MYRPSGSHDPCEQFLEQFEWDSGDWLYRYKETGPAYRVTDDEKDAFVTAFDRWQKWSSWGAVLILLGLMVAFIKTDLLPQITPFWPFGWLLALPLRLTIDLIGFRAPLRSLERRTPVVPALSKAARAQLALDRASPAELVGTAFAAAGFLFLFGLLGWRFDAIGLLVMVLFAWMVLRAIAQAVREWQVKQTIASGHAASIRT